MKKIFSLFILVVASNFASAQAFEKGGNYVNIGFGLDPFGVVGTTLWDYYNIGPVVAGYEVGITEKLGIGRIGVGGVVGQSFQGYRYNSGNYTKWNRTSIIARCAYHFDFNIDKMDVYAGVGAGVHIYGKEKTNDNSVLIDNGHVSPTHYVFGGIRYYFSNNFGVYAEAGDGLCTLNGGLVFKF